MPLTPSLLSLLAAAVAALRSAGTRSSADSLAECTTVRAVVSECDGLFDCFDSLPGAAIDAIGDLRSAAVAA